MIFRGFRFGMILQLALGPIAIYIFQVAISSSFASAIVGSIGVTIADGLFIILAILGIGTAMDRHSSLKRYFTYFGSIVLIVFGISIILSAFGMSVLPTLSYDTQMSNVFLQSIFLTVSNPLTIIFWAGVFSTRLSQENMKRVDMYRFGIGALLSTLVSLVLISFFGIFVSSFLSDTILQIINTIAGIILVSLGIRTLLPKKVTPDSLPSDVSQ